MASKDTTIRISQKTKKRLNSLDFVKKQSYDFIINYLVDFYKKRGKK